MLSCFRVHSNNSNNSWHLLSVSMVWTYTRVKNQISDRTGITRSAHLFNNSHDDLVQGKQIIGLQKMISNPRKIPIRINDTYLSPKEPSHVFFEGHLIQVVLEYLLAGIQQV